MLIVVTVIMKNDFEIKLARQKGKQKKEKGNIWTVWVCSGRRTSVYWSGSM